MNPNYDRALVFHLNSDHRAVAEALRAIESRFMGSSEPFTREAHLRSDLDALRDRLEWHFREEEQGGCLEEAVSRRPSLAAEVRRLEQEHPVLLNELRRVIDRLAAKRPEEPLDAVKSELDAFARRLREHEESEDRVLEKGLNVNMDVELEQF
jgi:hypothetical protein